MYLYIINCNISNTYAQYLLDHLTAYNGENCDIIEINQSNILNFTQGYLDKLTIGKLRYQLLPKVNCIFIDDDYILYYIIQTQQSIYFTNLIEKYILNIAMYDAYKCLNLLIQCGNNTDIVLVWGWSLLHYTARYNAVKCLKLLLDYGFDINMTNTVGTTPLHCASVQNNLAAVKLLVQAGANQNAINLCNFTPLTLARHYNCTLCANYLSTSL